ncbi:MAG: hypothetical protein QMD00_04000 [Hadesarchaea archaeon]|nr:hypothetical protein [Hadesarchaea archaeon]
MQREAWGVESLPVALMLGAVLGASTLAIGAACLDQAQRLSGRQRAIDSFNHFVERARMLGAGGVGSIQLVELELGGGEIIVDGELVQLMLDGELVRSDVLPLPVSAPESELNSGSYLIELKRGASGGCFLEVRGV